MSGIGYGELVFIGQSLQQVDPEAFINSSV